jgi:hypothetical protein
MVVLLALVGIVMPMDAGAQIVATPRLEGTAFVGGEPMSDGTVVLHHLSDGTQGDLDSVSVDSDGAFAFDLPNVPDRARSDIFFASVRHHGVLYFGPAITTAIRLDSVYEIQAYDTLSAPESGMVIPLQTRSIFFEPDSAGWRVTDLFQLRNDSPHTIVARPGGRVWAHPLPASAREVTTGEGEVAFDAASYEGGELVVRAALPPGERLFVVRYRMDSVAIAIPNVGTPETFDVLVREPAPPLEVEGLDSSDRVELEAGSTYMRFSGSDVSAPMVRILVTEEVGPPPVHWVAVILAMTLALGGLVALRAPVLSGTETVVEDRQSLLVQVARLDQEFEAGPGTPDERRAYQRRRASLLARIRAAS